jgi:hypothetical protein
VRAWWADRFRSPGRSPENIVPENVVWNHVCNPVIGESRDYCLTSAGSTACAPRECFGSRIRVLLKPRQPMTSLRAACDPRHCETPSHQRLVRHRGAPDPADQARSTITWVLPGLRLACRVGLRPGCRRDKLICRGRMANRQYVLAALDSPGKRHLDVIT